MWMVSWAYPLPTVTHKAQRLIPNSSRMAAPAKQGEHAEATKESGGWLGDDVQHNRIPQRTIWIVDNIQSPADSLGTKPGNGEFVGGHHSSRVITVKKGEGTGTDKPCGAHP